MSMRETADIQKNRVEWLNRVWLKLTGIERLTGNQTQLQTGLSPAEGYWLVAAEGHTGSLVIEGQFCPLRAGGVWIGSSEQRVEWIDRDPGGQGGYLLRFLAGFIADNDEKTVQENESCDPVSPIAGEFRFLPVGPVMDKCRLIESCMDSGNVTNRLRGDAAFYELLGMVLGSGLRGAATDLERARRELDERFAEAVPVDRLADLAGLSRYHFMRLFKEMVGKSVGDYTAELRLKEAKRLMEERHELSLRDVAERVGYADAAYFSRQFKKWSGLAPSVYIRNRAWKVAAYSWANIGQLLPLQIIPHAAPIDHFWNDYYRKKYKTDVKVLLSHDYEFNRQALSRARPDCIVALDYNLPEEERQALERIAPLLLVPWEETDWRGHLRTVAAYMDKAKEAESWLSRYDRRANQVKQTLPAAIREQATLILKITGQRLSVVGRRAATVFYEDLGVGLPEGVSDGEVWLRPVTVEQLERYSAANIVVCINADTASQAAWERLPRTEAWRRLGAVRERAVFRLPGMPWFEFPWGEYAAFNHGQMLEQLASGGLTS
ncbi:AraC family transcriptional regulator [Cohnella sp. GCM10012308]|uniref:AraC family transcriptional regulator n=1 Tax=Cohnella sp. GCM10012308 TaxID=3317329 RepID=UPI003608852B